jgi:hypothetical protein
VILRIFALAGTVALAGCGYHVSGHADALPPAVKTIAIPAFGNLTNRYRLSERIPAAIGREFLARTRYRIVGEPEGADAVLTGAVVNYMSFPNVTDPTSARAAGIQISVIMQVTLTEQKTGKVLFTRPSLEFRQRYEIAADQTAYFEESDVALDRLSRDVARWLVSSVLEAF